MKGKRERSDKRAREAIGEREEEEEVRRRKGTGKMEEGKGGTVGGGVRMRGREGGRG